MRALAELRGQVAASQAAARVADWFSRGLIHFTVWDPGADWHGASATYRPGTDWRSAHARCVGAWLAGGAG